MRDKFARHRTVRRDRPVSPGELDVTVASARRTPAALAALAGAMHLAAPAATALPRASHNAFVPLLLALVARMAFQSWASWADREALQASIAQQQPLVDNSAKLRSSLDALAADTQRLAQAGNPGAKLLVEELRRRGVTINPNAAPAEKR